jgi:hypothetical protein
MDGEEKYPGSALDHLSSGSSDLTNHHPPLSVSTISSFTTRTSSSFFTEVKNDFLHNFSNTLAPKQVVSNN